MNTKLNVKPENYTIATARFADRAADHAEVVWGSAGREITAMFRPADVARIIAEELAPELLIAREIAELERDIARLKLQQALARISEMESTRQTQVVR